METKKIAILRILQILEKYSDINHPLLQEKIAFYLEREYGIDLERKAISRNLNVLKDAGFDIISGRKGSYLSSRDFTDAEIRVLIDGVLSSRYIARNYSKELINKLCSLTNKYFRSHIKHMHSVNEWFKTDNQEVFYNIELIDEAIEKEKQISFDYNKYGIDKKMHLVHSHQVSPYQLVLQNQRYYLMARDERLMDIGFFRIDRITNMKISKAISAPVTSLERFRHGIDYKEISTALPYMFSDSPETIEFFAKDIIVDQIIDWFGTDIRINEVGDGIIKVVVKASPKAMLFWCLQYSGEVVVLSPRKLADAIERKILESYENYKQGGLGRRNDSINSDSRGSINYSIMDFLDINADECIDLLMKNIRKREYIAIPSWPSDYYYEYDINGMSVEKYHLYRFGLGQNKESQQSLHHKFNDLVGSLDRIALVYEKLGRTVEENAKVLSTTDNMVWNTYINFRVDDPMLEQCQTIFDKIEMREPIEDEERRKINAYKDSVRKDAELRLKDISSGSIAAYDVIIRAKRVCRLLSLGAPSFVVEEEKKLLAQAMVINAFAKAEKRRVDKSELMKEFMSMS